MRIGCEVAKARHKVARRLAGSRSLQVILVILVDLSAQARPHRLLTWVCLVTESFVRDSR